MMLALLQMQMQTQNANAKERCLIIIENFTHYLARVGQVALFAQSQGLRTLLILPSDADAQVIASLPGWILQTEDFSFARLDQLIAPVSRDFDLAGVACVFGYFPVGGGELVSAVVARLAKKYACRHNNPQALYRANNKFLMRERLAQMQLSSPKFALVSKVEECERVQNELAFPVVSKPAVGIASGFVRINANPAELRRSFLHCLEKVPNAFYDIRFEHDFEGRHFDNARQILCEEYMEGIEYTVEILCMQDDYYPMLVHEKFDVTFTGSTVLEPIVFAPTVSLRAHEEDEIKAYAVAVCRALELQHCFCHLELRKSATGPVVLEVNTRVGGSCIQDNIRAFYGLIYPEIFLAHACGHPIFPLQFNTQNRSGHLAMSVIYPSEKGYLREVNGLELVRQLPGVLRATCYCEVGEFLNGEDTEIFFIDVWYEAENEAAIRATDRRIRELIQYRIEEMRVEA